MKYSKFIFFTWLIFSIISASANAQQQPQPQIVAKPANQQVTKQVSTNNDVDKFLGILKIAINKDDPNELAKFISYPCRWNRASGPVMINNQSDFIKSYKLIMNKTVKDAILSSQSNNLMVTNHGFASNGGRIWFNPKKGIFVVNTLD